MNRKLGRMKSCCACKIRKILHNSKCFELKGLKILGQFLRGFSMRQHTLNRGLWGRRQKFNQRQILQNYKALPSAESDDCTITCGKILNA